MRNLRRNIAFLLTLCLATVLLCGTSEASVTASDYLSETGAALVAGKEGGTGKLLVFFDVTATNTSDELGVSTIKMYYADGEYIETIYGSTENGLIREDFYSHTGIYYYYGESGKSYYAEVTIFASRGGGSDSRTITTDVVTAP